MNGMVTMMSEPPWTITNDRTPTCWGMVAFEFFASRRTYLEETGGATDVIVR